MTSPVPDNDPAFAMLTLDDLYELHHGLCIQASNLQAALMNGQVARISPLSDEWRITSTRLADVHETACAAYAEIGRREQETFGDLDQYPLTGVPMVCTECRAPAVALSRGGWAHTDGRDGNTCPARPVKVMVAAGNENVPRG